MWSALPFSYHSLLGIKPMLKSTFSLTPLKYIFYLNRICLFLQAITTGKGKIDFTGTVEKFIKRAQDLL